jgi:hypothetical protein
MTLLRELPDDARKYTVDLSIRELNTSRGIFLAVYRRAVAFLTIILIGGLFAVVLLARELAPAPRPYAVAMLCFLLGLISVAVLNALDFELSRLVLLRQAKRTGHIFRNELPVEAAETPPINWKFTYVASAFGYLALLLWIVGASAAYEAFTSSATINAITRATKCRSERSLAAGASPGSRHGTWKPDDCRTASRC